MWFKLANATFTTHLGKMSDLSNTVKVNLTATGLTISGDSLSFNKDDASGATRTYTLTLKNNYVANNGLTATVTSNNATAAISGSGPYTLTVTLNAANPTADINITIDGAEYESGDDTTTYTFTINPTPSTATVTLTASGYNTVSGTGSKSITVANGTTVSWSVSASGYTTRTGNWTVSGSNKTENIELVEVNSEIDTSATRLTSYGDEITAPNRLASKAYIANIQNSFTRGTAVSYIEFPVAHGTNKVYYTEGDSVTFPVDVWVFDAATNTPIEKLVDSQNFTTSLSINDNYSCQTIVVPINRTFDYDFYFGYANVPGSKNVALAYNSVGGGGNYLSGTEFVIGDPITPGSSFGIPCAIYGTGSTYVPPDDVDDMNQVVYYNESAASVMAGNCYVASKAQTIPANTSIKVIDIFAKGNTVGGVNVYVVNADTNVIEEMLLNEASCDTIMSYRIGKNVIRLDVDKQYDHPIYFMFNADRPSNSSSGLFMKSGVTNSILLVDDERKPAVGDDLTDGEWKSGYNIGFAVYN